MMRSGGREAASWWRLLLPLLLSSLLWTESLAKDKPDVAVTPFDNAPLGLSYFEDSDVIVFHDIGEGVIYRSDDAGASWDSVSDIPEGEAFLLQLHEFDSNTAFVLTLSTKHYKTEDRGKTWTTFSTGESVPSEWQAQLLVFHADDPKRIIFNGRDSPTIFGAEQAVYTTDGFKNSAVLRGSTEGCWWAKSSIEFTTGDKDLDKDRTLCIVKDPFSFSKEDQHLVVSDSFFAVKDGDVDEFEPDLVSNQGATGVANLAVVKNFILVATASLSSDEMALYVTDDTLKWHRAMFPSDTGHDHSHQLNQEGYTIMESTNYSIQVDVMTSKPSQPMGVLFTSNSNGTYFTENIADTNRNTQGRVDFEKITGIQGVFLVNTVENAEEVENKGAEKKVVTHITFDDGRTFDEIKAGDDRLHLHSVTELDNSGRVFSSPAPGLVMGNGNTGKSLGSFSDANLYVSDDAGLSWTQALKGPHKYEFGGSGSVLVAVKDSPKEDVSEFSYSLDHGENWESSSFPDELQIKPDLLTTTQDSTSLKFLLIGESQSVYQAIGIDFHGLDKSKCGDKDMEDWHARVDEDGKSTCIMGHKQTYRRRKKSADCMVEADFEDPVPQTEDCECTDADFECDYNFRRDPDDRSKCKKIGPLPSAAKACKGNSDDTFMGSSGWRLIPGNTCKRTKGEQKDDEVEWKCSEDSSGSAPPASGEISHTKFEFDSNLKHFQKIYLEKGDASASGDETLLARAAQDESDGKMKVDKRIWLSKDHGKKWEQILDGEDIVAIYPHEYLKDVVFFTTEKQKVIYTVDRGQSFHSFEVPTKAATGFPLVFHPDKKDWLLWLGENCDTVGGSKSCFKEASLSQDRGDNWKTIMRFAAKCEFTGHSDSKFRPSKQIVCLAHKEEKNDSVYTVFTSNDFFQEDKKEFEGLVTNFATMSEFIVLTGEDDEGKLHAHASLDGKKFERAHFPHNFHEGHGNEYTLLDSSTHAVNLFVLTEKATDRQFGSIIKSNSNGTSYVLSAANVNSNEAMYVDFEKVSGLEGVVLINVVTNADKNKEKTKKLQTKISHNDGSAWGYLPPPSKDVDGKSYKCSSSSGDESCALHLHHYTERDDKRRTFAADTAVGLLFGVGNVGSTLGDIKDADTFMTTDGGITWKNVKKGHWTWQYGDQGSIIVLVQRATHGNKAKTKIVSYSVDEGNTWTDYSFADEEVTVLDITTLRSGTSRNFIVWCRSDSGKLFTVNIDFSGLSDTPCQFSEQGDSDYFLWSPKHPFQDDDCLFGHVAKYLRKKTDRSCYNEQSLQRLHEYSNCACSRPDYECAYNYELDNHGQCALVQGLEPLSGKQWCEDHPNATSWYEPTGYRRVPLSTCRGGSELDKTSTEHPCDGYEEEFERKRRTSGVAIFFAVVIPFGLAGFMGWYVYRNWSGKFGQIRLGDASSTSFDSDQPWVKYPVVALSAAGAMVAALPYLAASLWRTAAGVFDRVRGPGGGGRSRSWFTSGPRRFTTRQSFARGRGDYTMVDDDEGELLGEESDEDV